MNTIKLFFSIFKALWQNVSSCSCSNFLLFSTQFYTAGYTHTKDLLSSQHTQPMTAFCLQTGLNRANLSQPYFPHH